MNPTNQKKLRVKYWKLILGLLLLAFSIDMLSKPGYFRSSSNNIIDSIEGIKGFPVHSHIIAFGALIFGVGFTISAFSKKSKVTEAENDLICINCGATFETIKTVKAKCKKCGGKLEDIKGVFNRHPDLLSKFQMDP